MRKFFSKFRSFLALLFVVTTISQLPIAAGAANVVDKPGEGTVSPCIWLIEFED